jgi:RNA polymerase sigma factor (sigma-70 family)
VNEVGMHAGDEPDVALVVAARDGRAGAVDALVAGYLPLVYNIVGRALGSHGDVDDVVQETMLHALGGLPDLREPASFRSWLVVIAMRQVRNRYRSEQRVADQLPDDVADPGADFVDLTIARLHLADQRRDLAEATRWLSDDDRYLLSLWWLEASGRLSRTEVAAGIGLSPPHTAVRVQRMKAQLDASRAVVRALRVTPRCADLARIVADWDGKPNPLWRKRLARHTRECTRCQPCWHDLAPAERLLAGLPLVPPATGIGLPATHPLPGHQPPPTDPTGGQTANYARHAFGRLWQHAVAKPVVAGVTALAAAGAVVALPAHHTPVTTAAAAPATVVTGSPFVPTAAPIPTTTTTTTAPKPTTTVPAVPITTRSARKGVGTWYFTGVTAALNDVGAGWYYDWTASRANIAAPTGVEFVPMIRDAASVTTAILAQAKQQGTELLGFNEPDLAGQANMTASQALDLWPKLVATGLRLGSPSVAFGGDTPGGWLDQFMSGAAARGYRVDFIALHWYGSDFSAAAVGQLRSYVQAVYNRYHKPIWLTEYALINFGGGQKYPTQAQQAAFVTGSAAMLDALPYVQRYAWFALPSQGVDTGLYRSANSPTTVGVAYRAAK